ncbi:MAG: cyclase [Acidobacteria bacterium]|nr:MAG: cyclase [Acidobacteriota bacterium]
MKLIDVSVPLDATLPTYPSNTPFTLEPIKRIARGDSSNVSTIHMSAHAGTHVDAPRHFFDPGTGVEALPLEMLCGRARVVEITSRRIAADDLAALDESGARHLVDHGVKVVGIDYLSVEVFKSPGAPAHHVLLGAGAIVIEGLNLRDVEPGVYDMYCLPLRVVGSDGAPARVVLRRS